MDERQPLRQTLRRGPITLIGDLFSARKPNARLFVLGAGLWVLPAFVEHGLKMAIGMMGRSPNADPLWRWYRAAQRSSQWDWVVFITVGASFAIMAFAIWRAWGERAKPPAP